MKISVLKCCDKLTAALTFENVFLEILGEAKGLSYEKQKLHMRKETCIYEKRPRVDFWECLFWDLERCRSLPLRTGEREGSKETFWEREKESAERVCVCAREGTLRSWERPKPTFENERERTLKRDFLRTKERERVERERACVREREYLQILREAEGYLFGMSRSPRKPKAMGWLRLVGSIKLYISFAKEPYKRDDILQKRPVILSILLTVATPYLFGMSRSPWGPKPTFKFPRKTFGLSLTISKVDITISKVDITPPEKLLGDGLSTPVPLFCLICTIISIKTAILD